MISIFYDIALYMYIKYVNIASLNTISVPAVCLYFARVWIYIKRCSTAIAT